MSDIINITFCVDIPFSGRTGHICTVLHSLSAEANRSDRVIVLYTHLLPKILFIQENIHIPTGKGALRPSSKNTSSFSNVFSSEDCPAMSNTHNAENKLHLEGKKIHFYKGFSHFHTCMVFTTKISYFSVLPRMRRKMSVELLCASGYWVKS